MLMSIYHFALSRCACTKVPIQAAPCCEHSLCCTEIHLSSWEMMSRGNQRGPKIHKMDSSSSYYVPNHTFARATHTELLNSTSHS